MGAPKGHLPYNVNGEGGRPREWTDEKIEAEADAFEQWMNKPSSIYFKKFALERGYDPCYFAEWVTINKRFAQVFRKVKAWQEARLAEGGLTSEFNGGFTKFVMSNICQWQEKSIVEHKEIPPTQSVDYSKAKKRPVSTSKTDTEDSPDTAA